MPGRSTPPPSGSESQSVEQLTEIANWFYLRGLSQVEIARMLGLDPSTVSRHLKRARDEGIVYIEIRRPRQVHADLGRELADAFGLDRAVVVPEDPAQTDALNAVAADFIGGTLRTGMRLGVSWGQTLAGVVRFLQPRSVSDLHIAQLTGGLADLEPGNQCHELVRTIALLYPNSQVKYVHCPAIVDSPDIRDALMRDRSIREALSAAARSEVALVGIGSMTTDSSIIRVELLDQDDLGALGRADVVGSVNGRFFDVEGNAVDVLEDRTLSISWEQLRAIPMVIAVAAGESKTVSILGSLRTGAIDALITDETTARWLLKAAERPSAPLRAVGA